MGKRDDLIAKYAEDLKSKCGMEPDMDLLTKVTIGCGPAIYNDDASTVAATPGKRVGNRQEQLPHQEAGSFGWPRADGRNQFRRSRPMACSERNKYRAVVYYMLTKQFGKESVYS